MSYSTEYQKLVLQAQELLRQEIEGPLLKKIDYLQYQIDNLMLEFCPEEMTEEQIENWKRHQQVTQLTLPID